MSANAERRLFYRLDQISTVKQGEYVHTLFCEHGLPLAERHTGDAHWLDSPLALLATDMNGSMLRQQRDQQAHVASYTAYGYDLPASDVPMLMGFNAQPRVDLPMYLLGNGYRAYATATMRFNAPDNLSPFGAGGLNAYTYCAGDPVNRTDPSGHMLRQRPSSVLSKNNLLSLNDFKPLNSQQRNTIFNNRITATNQQIAANNSVIKTLPRVSSVSEDGRTKADLLRQNEIAIQTIKDTNAQLQITKTTAQREAQPSSNTVSNFASLQKMMNDPSNIAFDNEIALASHIRIIFTRAINADVRKGAQYWRS